jgi:hypothetical protein
VDSARHEDAPPECECAECGDEVELDELCEHCSCCLACCDCTNSEDELELEDVDATA